MNQYIDNHLVKIENRNDKQDVLLYLISRFLERASYFGIRALIVLYLVDGSMKLDRDTALYVYGLFTSSVIISVLLGGVLGDLILGNRRAILVGGMLQAFGSFALIVPSTFMFYTGLVLVSIGGGLYTSNHYSNYARIFIKNKKSLDAAFVLVYLTANIASFFGIIVLGWIGEKYGWGISFSIAGVFYVLCTTAIYYTRIECRDDCVLDPPKVKNRIWTILSILVLGGLFWISYSLSSSRSSYVEMMLNNSSSELSYFNWSGLNFVVTIVISICILFIWLKRSDYELSRFIIGFALALIALVFLFCIPDTYESTTPWLFIGYLVFMAGAEIVISALMFSSLVRNVNDNYMSIFIGIAIVITRLSYMVAEWLSRFQGESSTDTMFLSVLLVGVVLLGLVSRRIMKDTSKSL